MKNTLLFLAIILSCCMLSPAAFAQRLGVFSYDNTYGQLGNGTFDAPASTTTIYQVGSDTNWVAGACGADHNLAIKTDRTLWAWGRNHKGQLGDSTLVNKNTPTQVGVAASWAKFDGGGAFSMAIKTDGTLWGWGDNSQGQLGDGTTIDKLTPVQIGTAADWLAVTCGWEFVLAMKTDSTLWAWGDNAFGQLGDGTTTDKLAPVQIGTDKWIQIAAGSNLSIGMKSDSLPFTWGQGATTITVFYNGKVMKIDATPASPKVWAIKTDSILSCFTSPTSMPGGSGNATPDDFACDTCDTIDNTDSPKVQCPPGQYFQTGIKKCQPCRNTPYWLSGTPLIDIAMRNDVVRDFVSISGDNTVRGGSVFYCVAINIQYDTLITTSQVWSRIDGGAKQALVVQAGCTNPLAGGTIGADQSINYNTVPATLTNVTAPAGQSGLLEYKWQSSANGITFADIPLSNAADFSPGALTVTTWYRRLARVDCMANWTGAAVSNPVTITVGPELATPTLTTQAASAITAISATGNGNITSTNGINPTVRGIIYWLYNNTDQIITDANVTDVPENGSPDFSTGAFTRSLTGLSVNTRYNAKAYATNTNGTGYGTRTDFWTLANVPTAPTVNNPTATTLDVTVNVNSNPASTEFAIHETSTGNFVQTDGTLAATAIWQNAATWGTKTVTGLTTGTEYTFEVKACNGGSVETAYGATVNGTPVASPTVTTQAASAVTASSATCNGNITSVNGTNATDRGIIYYSYTDTDKEIGDAEVTNVNETGSPDFGTGAFTASLTTLSVNTRYNARAHATNLNGTGYGERCDFWTLANVPGAPTVDNATATTLDVTVAENSNPAGTGFVIHVSASGLSKFVQADGTLGVTAVWQNAATWGTKTVTGLTTGTEYTFEVKARNGGSVETAYGTSTSANTCSNPTNGGQIGSAQSICTGTTPNGLTSISGASNYGGTLEYKWQYSTTSSSAGFSDIAASNATTYSSANLTETTWYKRLARVDCKTDWTGAAESNTVTITVNPYETPSVSIALTSGTNPSCPADMVTFTATPTNGGLNPAYEWFLNGVSVASSANFTLNPADGDQVYVVMTTSLQCYTEATTTSNVESLQVTNPEVVSVSIVATRAPGGQVKFTATPVNGGANPTYKWFKNNVEIPGATGPELISTCLKGDEHYVILHSSLPCTASAQSSAMCTN